MVNYPLDKYQYGIHIQTIKLAQCGYGTDPIFFISSFHMLIVIDHVNPLDSSLCDT